MRDASIELIDEVASFTLSDPGGSDLEATLTANTGVLNRTLAAFGINADGFADDTDTIDGDEVAEMVTITFNMAVTFDNFTVTPIPEPGSLAFIGATLVAYGVWRRRRSTTC